MSYELLYKLYYKDRRLFEQEYSRRRSELSSVSLGFSICGEEAFYVSLPEFIPQIAGIYKKFAELNRLCMELPEAAYKSYERKCLIDEIILTNDIEGIRSTRKEIISVLDEASSRTSAKKKRFDGMVRKYALLLDDSDEPYKISLNTAADVRALYDDIVSEEIDKPNLPDGKLFRKDIAEVISATQQVKHIGVHPESEIIACMDKALGVFKNEDIPELYKIAIFHYMLGYIHPFYDGNGRLSRFISSYLLKEEFNTLAALRLSYTIKDRKRDYYKAFDLVNDVRNKGDLTPFIMYFSGVAEQSFDSLIERLSSGKEILDSFRKMLISKYAAAAPAEKRKTQDVLWCLVQNELFSGESFGKKDLAEQLKTSPDTAHRYVKKLASAGAPIEVRTEGKKTVYKLDSKKLSEYLQG